jgi:hypothetical protein
MREGRRRQVDISCAPNRTAAGNDRLSPSSGELGLSRSDPSVLGRVTNPSHLEHPNFVLSRKTYSQEELLTRGMAVLLRKHGSGAT